MGEGEDAAGPNCTHNELFDEGCTAIPNASMGNFVAWALARVPRLHRALNFGYYREACYWVPIMLRDGNLAIKIYGILPLWTR